MSPLRSVRNWLDQRLGWDDLIAPLRKKTVPLHKLSYWYFLGGITLFLFVIQVLTGILLVLYYRPGANEAFESVQYIMTQVQFGWLIRSIHSWSANLMIFTAFAHMFSVLFLKAYRKPRELTWVSGVIPYIRQFNPSLRTDQLDQYRTSVHGKRLAAGDTKVAVCTDCHSVHDLRAPSDPSSTVNPVNVANTCARCHSDADYMKGYSTPTNQFANYSTSVHHEALAVRGDLSAPTCTTCHGNHGAAPPGVDKVQNVCSNCHAFQAQMYEKSSHKKANHGISHPTDAMLGTGPDGVCMRCHTPGDACDRARVGLQSSLSRLDQAIKSADQVLGVAESSGMEVSESRLGQDQVRDSLTKARVTIHSFRTDLVDQDI